MKKFNKLSDEDNKMLLAEVCVWIDKNIETNIGWEVLCDVRKLNHKELQFLFEKYLQTSPMTYIRKQKEQSKKIHPVYTITENFKAKPSE
jgi:AraC-like DNA-binding protein